MEATERLGWATGQVEASGQKSALGGQAILQAVTRVKLEQASKALCLGWQAKTSRNIGCSAFAIIGPATSNGSRPSSQWWIATPSDSAARLSPDSPSVAAEAKTDYTAVKNNLLMRIFLTQHK
jgi:hypothetical protein